MASGENTRLAAWSKAAGVPLLLATVLVLAAAPARAALGDLVFERQDQGVGIPPAIFQHWVHRIRYRCSVCHPALFEMKAGADKITMDSLNAGKFCGACHNGSNAFNVEFQTCTRCHREPEE